MKTTALLLIGIVLTGCISETENDLDHAGHENGVVAEGADETQKVTGSDVANMAENEDEKPSPRVLDLTLPEDTSFEGLDSNLPNTEPPPLFDSKKLFDQKKKRGNISVKVRPDLNPGATLTDPPSIEGGSVEVTIKTE